MRTLYICISLLCLSVFACKDAFTPDVEAHNKNLLVVEGYIHIGGSTTIRINRTVDVAVKSVQTPEAKAEVAIETSQGELVVGGISNAEGVCILNTVNLSATKQYRIRITTSKGKVYQSEVLTCKVTPAIDSLNFRIENGGFQVYANTHDDSNNTRYYTWDFDETWEIRSPYPSAFEVKDNQIVSRDPSINISRCWLNGTSSRILLGTSERLVADKISQAPLIHLKGNDEKVSEMYSILVRQYAITKEAYLYLDNMRKNTEQIGGIFDPQPSEIKGNMVCVSDPAETVIGYISAGTVVQKRLFISKTDKPAISREWMFAHGCERFWRTADSVLLSGGLIIEEKRDERGMLGYDMSTRACIDCRFLGSNIKPSYWPN
jgi:hypothetical protein